MIKSVTVVSRTLLCALFLLVLRPAVVSAQDDAQDRLVTRYARYGADVWAANPMAAVSGEGEACISCHTSLPYALIEPLLPGPYQAYADLIDNVNNRIRTWSDNTAWYAERKRREIEVLGGLPPGALDEVINGPDSRGSEAVLNVLIRAMHDAYSGGLVQAETRQAFEHLWSEQVQTGPKAGRWKWIQANLIPWEVDDSDLWGASLACVAASLFSELAPPKNLRMLHDALRQAVTSDEVSLHTKAAILWCDTESGGQVLEDSVSRMTVADILAEQRQDGGWALRDLGPWVGWAGSDSDCCAQREVRPDAYATGFMTLALARRSKLGRDQLQVPLQQAVAWISRELANPYPAEPRYNRHTSSDKELPALRNNLYTNAGHMWAFLAKTAHERQAAPWSTE